MNKMLTIAAAAAAGITYAAPAHADVTYTGGMRVGPASASQDYPIHVELIGNGSTERMTAANGCVEEWSDMPGAATGKTPIQGGDFFTGFVNINVISGEQYGCTSQPGVQVGVRHQGSRHTLTARSADATWELYGDF